MYSRHTTPPSAPFAYIPESAGHISSDGTYFSQDSSPDSVITAHTTPPRSPIRQHGPLLLPKVRPQDQVTEPTGGPVRHRRTTSNSSIGYSSFSPYSRPNSLIRRGTSPPSHSALVSPISQPSPYETSFSALNSPISFTASESRRPSLAHARSHSTSAVRGHTRSGSAGSIDESVISRFGFPTYRQLPNYVTTSSAAQSSMSLATALPSSYHAQVSQVQEVSQYATATAQDFQVSDFDPAPAVQYPLPAELQFETFQQPSTTTLLDYLTAQNPSPNLVRRVNGLQRGIHTHFWWDIRNLRSWTDFNINTIISIPGLLPLLEVPVPSPALPTPGRPNLSPETESALHDICNNHYAAKVNAALKVAQGNSHMMMRAYRPTAGARQQPEFISNYQSDYEKTIFGDGRGRVVGLVKAYDQWNTGMRGEAANKQVYYLQGLSHLHRVMREHGCRYGFIMTEIELLCVRCGGPSSAATQDPTIVNAQDGVPIFGYLEVSAPIRLSTHGRSLETDEPQMTAALALWYLHMLAKESPLPGMGSWRMDVGGPAALTRQNCLDKDEWIPKPNNWEKREAKRLRGWIFPEEPLSRKEVGRGKRARSRS